jgi:hypothetical protein
MIHLIKYIIIGLLIVTIHSLTAQTWPKTYGEPDRKDESYDIAEAYDKGFYILGLLYSQDYAPKSTWLIKTDINGEILWEKVFQSGVLNKSYMMEPTRDGGILVCGGNWKTGNNTTNPFVVKLNACGEKEWCYEFTESPYGNMPWASDVKETPSGDIIVLVNQYGNHPIHTMHLFKLNAGGEVLWRNSYAHAYNHPGSLNPRGNKLLITSTGEYLITGDIYWEDIWNPGSPMGLRSLFVLIDSIGNEKWVLPFGANDTITGKALMSYQDSDTTFVAICTNWTNEVNPLFLSYDIYGNIIEYNTIEMNTINPDIGDGIFTRLRKFNTNYLVGGGFYISSSSHHDQMEAVFDSNYMEPNYGVLKYIIHNENDSPYDMIVTRNQKVLSSSKHNSWDIYLAKLNTQLEMDTLDPNNYTYDSLCTTPGLPQSGFISLDDCGLFTDIDEIPTAKQYREKIRWIPITAYPNPVTEGKLTMEFENTQHHQNMELHCYDNFGRLIHSRKIYNGQQDTVLDVSTWPPGIYIAVVYSDGSARGKAKFEVR